MSRAERLEQVQRFCDLTEQEVGLLSGELPVAPEIAEHLIENVLGYFPIPFGVATGFVVDGRSLLIPMAVEETSIIAAASSAAKWVSREGKISTRAHGRLIIGQVQIPSIRDRARARQILNDQKQKLIDFANSCFPSLMNHGGGIYDLVIREIEDSEMFVIHVLCDPGDAMGANLINQVCEALKPRIEELTAERVGLCILSNLVDTKRVSAEVVIRNIDPQVGRGIAEATHFAQVDPYRAATHNKGILNGIDPILIATGNDWRAVEAGVHAYASRSGKYQPLSEWKLEGNDLKGRIEIPMAVGIVGGVTRIHPIARIALKMLGVQHAEDLGRICAAVGLVQNLGALKALATVGIVKGHMQLHAANLALAAGAEVHEIHRVRDRLTEVLRVEKRINLTRAKEVLESIRVASQNSVQI